VGLVRSTAAAGVVIIDKGNVGFSIEIEKHASSPVPAWLPYPLVHFQRWTRGFEEVRICPTLRSSDPSSDREQPRRVKAKQSFREFRAAQRTIAGYEALHMIRKGQARWVSDADVRHQNQFIDRLFYLAV
jgi:hypothetical protein